MVFMTFPRSSKFGKGCYSCKIQSVNLLLTQQNQCSSLPIQKLQTCYELGENSFSQKDGAFMLFKHDLFLWKTTTNSRSNFSIPCSAKNCSNTIGKRILCSPFPNLYNPKAAQCNFDSNTVLLKVLLLNKTFMFYLQQFLSSSTHGFEIPAAVKGGEK